MNTENTKRLLIGIAVIALIAVGIYAGSTIGRAHISGDSTATSSRSASSAATGALPQASSFKLAVTTNDDAVRAYLKEAQLHAEIYKFTNNGAYNGMCELTDKNNLFNLELGVLRYVKAVGATGVFCFTSSDQYMIEAKLPEKGDYFCIDDTGYAGEQDISHQKDHSCTQH